MVPIQLAGLAFPGIMLLSKYNGKASSGKRKIQYRLRTEKRYSPDNRFKAAKRYRPAAQELPANPLGKLFRGLSSTLSQLSAKSTKEDYEAVIRSFLPAGTTPLIPQYPANSKHYYLADIDGDSRSELVTSFKQNNEIKTLILKKQTEKWQKAAEISNSGYDALNYRSAVNMTGNGRKYLLLGLATNSKEAVLHGYMLENNAAKEIFKRSYHKFEVINSAQNNTGGTQLAVWKKKDAESYDIEVLGLNGTQLEPVKDAAPHYQRSVIPHYVQLIKQSPYTTSNWYNLADALSKAGLRKDALTAIDVGAGLDKSSEYKEKFTALKNKILSGKK